MQNSKNPWLILLKIVFFLVILLLPANALAQSTPSDIIILDPDPRLKRGGFLSIPFVVRDETGRVMHIEVVSATIASVEDVSNSKADITELPVANNILLLLDSSTSLGVVSGEVLLQAIQFVDEAPQGTRFAVVTFNDHPQLVLEFTDDKSQIMAALSRINQYQGGTCLYNAVHHSIELVHQAKADELYATGTVVVISDGRDELSPDNNQPCSQQDLSSAVDFAITKDIPVYAIGIQGDLPVNQDVLFRLAEATGGLAATGTFLDIPNLRQQIVAGLTRQWQAEARIYTDIEGRHSAILTVRLQDGTELAQPFQFISDGVYPRPPGPVQLWVTGLELNEQVAEVQVEVENPENANALRLRILQGQREGSQIGEMLREDPANIQTLQMPLSELEPGQEYHVEVCAIDDNGLTVKDEKGDLVCASSASFLLPEQEVNEVADEPSPSWPSQLLTSLKANPWIIVAIVVVVVGATGWLMFQVWQQREPRGIEREVQGAVISVLAPPSALTDISHTRLTSLPEPLDNRVLTGRLQIESSPDTRQTGRILLINGDTFTIGRKARDLSIEDHYISRKHVTISFNGKGYEVTDEKSSNGTFLEGQRLQPEDPIPLAIGETRIQLGPRTYLTFTVEMAQQARDDALTAH